MKRWFSYLVAVPILLSMFPQTGNSQTEDTRKRIALVIGNGAYQNAAALPNPTNDASDVGAALARLGFDVKLILDGKSDRIRAAVDEFNALAASADLAVAFYAGHGIEAGGENWLLPTDAQIDTNAITKSTSVNLRVLSQSVGKAKQLGLVILDACRDNPFQIADIAPGENIQRRSVPAARTRSVSKGLAAIEPPANVLIAFAAKDGTVATDGSGRNSPFTKALLGNIEKPGLEVSFLFRRVRDEVIQATNSEQQPYVYGSLSKDPIYLAAAKDGTLLQPEDLPPRSKLFADSDIAKIAAIASRQKLALPPYEIHQPDDVVPSKYRRFVGVWSSRHGYNGVGRQAMLIITDVSGTGLAKGYYLLGPAKRVSFNQDPPNYRPIISQIVGDSIRFGGGYGITTITLRDRNMRAAVIWADGRTAAVTMEAVWTLAAKETAH